MPVASTRVRGCVAGSPPRRSPCCSARRAASPHTVDRPVAPAADGTWADEPSAASLDRGRRPHRRAAARAEQFYFVLPDRFANGDPRNDTRRLPGRPAATTATTRPTRASTTAATSRACIDRLDYIEGLGTTAIWLAPVFKNRPVQGSGADVSAGYHGYWITDFTAVDPHFGTEADLQAAGPAGAPARHQGLPRRHHQPHRRRDPVRREPVRLPSTRRTARTGTRSGRPFDDRDYADGDRGFPAVERAQSFPYTPVFATPADAQAKEPAWLNDPTMYHNRGDSTFAGENSEYGDFFGLDDLWTERPEVVRGHDEDLRRLGRRAPASTASASTPSSTSNLEFWPQFAQGIAAAPGGQAGLLHVRRGLQRRPGDHLDVRAPRRPAGDAGLPVPGRRAELRRRRRSAQRARRPVRRRRPLHRRAAPTRARLPTFLGNHDMGRIGMFDRAPAAPTRPATCGATSSRTS